MVGNIKSWVACTMLFCDSPSLSDDSSGRATAAVAFDRLCGCAALRGCEALPACATTLEACDCWTGAAERYSDSLSPALMELFKCSIVASVNTNWNACCSIVQISSASA